MPGVVVFPASLSRTDQQCRRVCKATPCRPNLIDVEQAEDVQLLGGRFGGTYSCGHVGLDTALRC
jgi:hypothetical protein